MSYCRLTLEERYQIYALYESKLTIRDIANFLNRAASTISRELKRNKGRYNYKAKQADNLAKARRSGIGPKKKITGKLKSKIDAKLRSDWSPDQIVGRFKLKKKEIVCAETIYQYVFRDKKEGGDLWMHLRRRRSRRWPRAAIRNMKGGFSSIYARHTSIKERPEEVNKKQRAGDYERDLILDKNKSCILTIIDRASRLSILEKLNKLNANDVHKLTVASLKDFPVYTVTNDNGIEFSGSKQTEIEISASIYFSEPKSRGQNGAIENLNGLVRRYFPKRKSLKDVTTKDVKIVQSLLNNRPKKCLGYKTPNEVFWELSGCCVET